RRGQRRGVELHRRRSAGGWWCRRLDEAIAQRLCGEEIRIEREGGSDFDKRVLLIAGVREGARGCQVRLKSLPPFAVSHDSRCARPVPMGADLYCSTFALL